MKLRKGALKGSGKKGYYNWYAQDPKIHSQSAKGMKQPQLPIGADGDVMPALRAGHRIAKAKPEPTYTDKEQEFIDYFDAETLKSFKEHVSAGIVNVRDMDDTLLVECDDGTEWRIFESNDDAERIAIDQVRDDLEDDPSMFNQDWLQNHITISETDRRIIALEESDNLVDGVYDDDQILEEADVKDEYDDLEAAKEDWQMKQDEVEEKGGTADYGDKISEIEQKQEKLIDDARENVRGDKYDDIYDRLDDPIKYFVEDEGMYSREDLLKAPFIQIDTDKAAKDAVDTDGWEHFLSRYDGNSTELANGRVMVREN